MRFEDLLEDKTASRSLMKKILLIVAFTVLLIYAVFHLDGVLTILNSAIKILSPFLIGIVIAFVLNILVKLFEEKVFRRLNQKNNKLWNKCRRAVCMLIVIILVLLFLALIVFLIVPELANSIAILTEKAPVYAKQMQTWVINLLKDMNITQEQMDSVQKSLNQIDWTTVVSKVTTLTSDFVGSVVTLTVGVTSGVVSFFMSFIFAIYMMANKEKLLKNLKRVLYAFLPEKTAHKAISIGSLANHIFAGFVSGQCTEALIIGVLSYLGMSLMGLPYALLISTVIAVTSVIPIFGAYIGAIFGGLILLLVKPWYCLIFVIYIVVLQNVEGNLIYPRVVGSSVGLPGLWVMLSIFVCGDLFGFAGVLMGVPTFSVLYSLLRSATKRKLEEKDISDREVLANHVGIPPEPTKTELIEESPKTEKKKDEKIDSKYGI